MFKPKKSVIERYGLSEFSPHGPHDKIVSMMGKGCKVLDVGCGVGKLGKYLKEKLNCYVVGIEADEEAAKAAEKFYDEVIVADVEQLRELKYPHKYFDTIIMADILEHLKRPDMLLIKLKPYLKPEGSVIASIPNIARLETRIKLLLGKFEYQETGILDKTHLRFFTLKTAKELFESTGYRVIQVDYTGLASKHRLFRSLPTLFAFQLIIVAKPE
jgi:2-polyprenyl-3-methyl-5-hydroxy-6-metoxy-1,4-benzoquinol methylase